MIQDVLTYLLIASATAYILFGLYRMVFPSKKYRSAGCPGCSGCDHTTSPGVKISHPRSYSSDSGSAPAGAADKEWVPRDFASSGLADRLQ
jgi:hypothetical protein